MKRKVFLLLMITAFKFSHAQRVDSTTVSVINMSNPSFHLKQGSKNQLVGIGIMALGGIAGGLLVSQKESQTGIAVMAIGFTVGFSFNISGIIHYGKAGKYME